MSARFEELVVFWVMAILVGLFAWIYSRDRRKRTALWMWGWIAILVHFTAPAVDDFFPPMMRYTDWVKVITLIVAGTLFLLSVSKVFGRRRRRIAFVVFISTAAAVYTTCLFWGVRSGIVYAALLLASSIYATQEAVRFYGWKSTHLYSVCLLLPYGLWTVERALQGYPERGLEFYLFGFFYIIGLVYLRNFERFTPGVIFTSASFIAWGCVFPVASILSLHAVGPAQGSFFWDLPKFFVAFGMILTLFEDQTVMAQAGARHYQLLFENNLAGVYVSSLEGQLLNCNGAFLRMYGFDSREEALAHSTALCYDEPSEREHFLRVLDEQGQVLNYECTQRRKDGSIFWILERATLVTEPDGRQFIEGTAIDITERKHNEIALKQSEERFATIFRQSPIGCGILSLDGVFLNVNDNLLRMLAMPAEKVIGANAVDLGFWQSHRQRDDFYQRLRAEGSIQNMEIRFKDATGVEHVGSYFATLVRIADKECIFGMQLDRTEERELEAKFLQAQKMEALGRMAGGVAHDFNNMLGIIGGYAELMGSKVEDNESLRLYCDSIVNTTQRASGLTRQLLTFSRKEIVRPEPLNTGEALRELSLILPRLIGEDIELVVDLRASGSVVIDKTHFEQIIFNIVINSRDAMPSGGQVFLETEDVLRPALTASGAVAISQYVAIRIRDTGGGMDEDTRLHAFEPFYTTKEPGRGTGLGLATVYGIVQQCRGEISLDSSELKGTQVSILLPASLGGELEAVEASCDEIKKGQGNILLVEDEIELRNVNAEYLGSLGYSVFAAGSGPEALQFVTRGERIDLVISDVVMPKMSGREFAEWLHLLRPNTRLLYISGYPDDVVLQNGVSLKGLVYLQKPYSLRELARKVQSLLSTAPRSA